MAAPGEGRRGRTAGTASWSFSFSAGSRRPADPSPSLRTRGAGIDTHTLTSVGSPRNWVEHSPRPSHPDGYVRSGLCGRLPGSLARPAALEADLPPAEDR